MHQLIMQQYRRTFPPPLRPSAHELREVRIAHRKAREPNKLRSEGLGLVRDRLQGKQPWWLERHNQHRARFNREQTCGQRTRERNIY